MTIIAEPITGQESSANSTSPYSVLADFYRSFNSRDFGLMEKNWLQTADASMSNPLGGIKRGWHEIKGVYEKIFNGPAEVYVEFYDYSIYTTDGMFIAAGRERGTLKLNNQSIDLAIRTSRVYCLDDKQWKQLHHHGSMDEPELLATYQTILRRK